MVISVPGPNYPRTSAQFERLKRTHPDLAKVRRIGVLADLIVVYETGMVDPAYAYADLARRELGMGDGEVEHARRAADAHMLSDRDLFAARQTRFEDIGERIMREMARAPYGPDEGSAPHPDYPLFE